MVILYPLVKEHICFVVFIHAGPDREEHPIVFATRYLCKGLNGMCRGGTAASTWEAYHRVLYY